MRTLTGLMDLAFGHAQEVTTVCTELERSRGLRDHGFYGIQIADAAVSALAHISAATAGLTGTYREREEARNSIRGARQSFSRLKELLKVVRKQHYVEGSTADRLLERIHETQVLLMVVSVELSTPALIVAGA